MQLSNKQQVMIYVQSEQWDSDQSETQPIKLLTTGTLEYDSRHQAWIITYEESPVTGMEGTVTTITLYPQQLVRLQRKGSVEMDMTFASGQRYVSQMRTDYGYFDLTIMANEVGGSLNEKGGNIHIGYSLKYGDKDTLSTKLNLIVQNNDQPLPRNWMN